MAALTFRVTLTRHQTMELLTPIKIRRRNAPLWHEAMAQWDTGASGTCITQAMAERLELVEGDRVGDIDRPDHPRRTYKDLEIVIPGRDEAILQTMDQVDEHEAVGVDVLIGMDLIARGDFAVTSVRGDVWFSFCCPPKDVHIDFTGTGPIG